MSLQLLYVERAKSAEGLRPETETQSHNRRLQKALLAALELADYWKWRALMREVRRGQRLVLALVILAVATPAAALTVNGANFYWQWEPDEGGVVASEFRLKCGLSAGVYPTVVAIQDPAARSYPVKSLVAAGNGTYHCVVTAATDAVESAPSAEVVFQRKGQRIDLP